MNCSRPLSPSCSSSLYNNNDDDDDDNNKIGSKYGDPENPVCGRLTLTGELVVLDSEIDAEEYNFAKQALFERHSTMESWPSNHQWVIAKIVLEDIWLIDFFGGAAIIDPETYFGVSLLLPASTPQGVEVEDEDDEAGK